MSPTSYRARPSLVLVVLAVVVVVGLVAATAFGATHKRPDLVVSKLSNPPPTLGHSFLVRARIANIGKAHAGPSTTVFYLSTDRKPSRADRVAGRASAPALGAGEHRSTNATLVPPAGTKPGPYFVIACADRAHKVQETHEGNNCRSSQSSGTLPCRVGDADCDGFLTPADCNDHAPAIHPGAPDTPDLGFVDSNCDGLDGNAQRAVFVSGIGDDGAAGTRAQPKRTLAAAVAAATAAGKDVYATLGIYNERLNVANGVSVYGGYDTSWRRSLSNETRITGDYNQATRGIEGAAASNVSSPTALQLLTLEPREPGQFDDGFSSYGLRGVNSGGLRLERVSVHAAVGAAGVQGGTAITGGNGANGHDAPAPTSIQSCGTPGQGGTSPGSGEGGRGGVGGARQSGHDGLQGLVTSPDAFGREGGPGGQGGAGSTVDEAGSPGYAGDSGVFQGNGSGGAADNGQPSSGFWQSRDGQSAPPGTDGYGGGGGGGGGAQSSSDYTYIGGGGGGGGGGGKRGGGGGGGQGGGGSFGIFLVDSAGAVVRSSVVTASDGGAGGVGGAGAAGGTGGTAGMGTSGCGARAASGNDGGRGGHGGRGGDGGGAAGGPSIAIFGLASSDTSGTTVGHGSGGAGGAGGQGTGGGGGHGADGASADYQ